jgi:hypothetical protein
VRFFYLDRAGKAFEQWNNRAALPSAVAVQIDVPQRGPLFPRPLILPIPVNYSADCIANEDDGEEKPPRCTEADPNQQPARTQTGVPGRPPGVNR